MLRSLFAVLLAPLAAVPVLAVLYGPWVVGDAGLGGLMPVAIGTLLVAYPTTILFGIPVHVILRRYRCTTLADYAAAGALLGGLPVVGYCIVAIVFEAKFAPGGIWQATVRNVEWGAIGTVVFAAGSAAVGASFWWMAVRHPHREIT
jgi:hypothetical protein